MPENDIKLEISGHLDIFVNLNDDVDERGQKETWKEILIHGDPEGLESLARLLLNLSHKDQTKIDDKVLPNGARDHIHLRPNIELSRSSDQIIIGRLDAKGTGAFYKRYIPKKKSD
jgi:hypothetical protein